MKGIIVASFGTSYREAYKKSIGSLVEKIKANYKDYYITESYSSEVVRSIIKNRDKENIFNMKEALLDMEEKGIEDIYVLSLYVIEGFEYEKIIRQAIEFNFDHRLNIKLSRGLLSSKKDLDNIKTYFLEQKQKDPYTHLYMGHGSHHKEDKKYFDLGKKLEDLDNIYLATVEGDKSLDELIITLKEKQIENICLKPFMLVSGDHASNDLASNDKDSWKSILEKEGFNIKTRLVGLCEDDQIQRLFLEKLKEII